MTEPTGRRMMRGETSYVVLQRTFRAPIDEVWAAVTDSSRLARWIGTWTGDPTAGQVEFAMTAEGEDVQPQTYRIDVCLPSKRLVVRTWSDDDPGTVWHLELDLAEADGVTTLTFAQVMSDPEVAENVGPGWDYYLDRLITAETGGEPDAVVWDDYYPALAGHYRAQFS